MYKVSKRQRCDWPTLRCALATALVYLFIETHLVFVEPRFQFLCAFSFVYFKLNLLLYF